MLSNFGYLFSAQKRIQNSRKHLNRVLNNNSLTAKLCTNPRYAAALYSTSHYFHKNLRLRYYAWFCIYLCKNHPSLSQSFVSSYILAASPTTFIYILIKSSRLNIFLPFSKFNITTCLHFRFGVPEKN